MKSLLSLGTLIDSSFEHYKKHLPSILGTSLWLLVAAIPSALGILPSEEGTDLNAITWTSFILNVLGGIITVCASLHISVALILGFREQKQGKHTDPRHLLRKALSLDLSYLWAMILRSFFIAAIPLVVLGLAIGALFFVLTTENGLLINIFSVAAFVAILVALGGAVKFSLHYAFVPFTTVLDGTRGMESLKKSASLVRGSWWKVFWRIFLPKALYTLLCVALLGILLWTTGIVAVTFSQESFFIAKLFALLNFFISTAVNVFLIPMLLMNDYYIYEDLLEAKE